MINKLKLYHFERPNTLPQKHAFDDKSKFFELTTCQRSLYLSFEKLDSQNAQVFEGQEAYRFMLEILCGLKSRLIAENEIVSQVKKAYDEYLLSPSKNSQMVQLLQKLFQDSKKIRTDYLKGVAQKTYAALTRKILQSKMPTGSPLVIFGSGQLAEDLINQFKKKYDVHLSARNQEAQDLLINKHNIKTISWMNFDQYAKHAFLINTIGCEDIIFDQSFLTQWKEQNPQGGFVDLGEPSPLELTSNLKEQQCFYPLEIIYQQGAIANQNKTQKINLALEKIHQLTQRRDEWFKKEANDKAHYRNQGKPVSDSSSFVHQKVSGNV